MSDNCKSKQNSYATGDVYWVNLYGTGHVQSGWHPCIIVQNNVGNLHSMTMAVVPITSKSKTKLPTHVFLKRGTCGLPKDSIAQCEGQQVICKTQVGDYIGTMPIRIMQQIATGCLINTPYLDFLSEDDISKLKKA